MSQLSTFQQVTTNEITDLVVKSAWFPSSPSYSQGNIRFSVWVSFAEIYNEFIFDLLDSGSKKKSARHSLLQLREDKNGMPYIITSVIRLVSYLAMPISAQPLLSQLSSDWQAIWRCLSQHSHCYHSCHQIGKLFGDAYLRTGTAITAVNGFKKTGISPFNPSDWLAIWRCLFKGSHHCYSHLKKTYSVMQTSLARIKSGLKINEAAPSLPTYRSGHWYHR